MYEKSKIRCGGLMQLILVVLVLGLANGAPANPLGTSSKRKKTRT